jgi:subtilase family serine protease
MRVVALAYVAAVVMAAVHHAPELPASWQEVKDISGNIDVNVTFALSVKQPEQGLERIRQYALRASTPNDSLYGRFLTTAEIDALCKPDEADLSTVWDWATAGGCEVTFVREMATIGCSKPHAEKLLGAEIRRVANDLTKQSALRAGSFTLPNHVDNAVTAVYGLHGLPLPPRRVLPSDVAAGPKITPDVLRSLYSVGTAVGSSNVNNRQAVAEFQDQTMKVADLTAFFAQYVPSADKKDAEVYRFQGDPGEGTEGVEAGLDIQYIMGVAPKILTEFWYQKSGDFCNDLKIWSADILVAADPPHVHSVSYGFQGNLPQIGCKEANVKDVDANFAKLAAKGITIIFASGDAGSGYVPTGLNCDAAALENTQLAGTIFYSFASPEQHNCCLITNAGGGHAGYSWTKPKSKDHKNCVVYDTVTGNSTAQGVFSALKPAHDIPRMWPSWPSTSPWVTAVGATRFSGQKIGNPEMASVDFGSGGGFSFMFPAFDAQKSATTGYLANAPDLPPAGSYPPTGRGTADISALGEGYQVVVNGKIQSVGGTSASTPAFAALISLLNEARLKQGKATMGYLNPWIYANPQAFTDVVLGTNAIGRGTGPLKYGFNCTKGWDPATGLGTPIFTKMLDAAMRV